MGYETLTVKDAVLKITNNEMYLPAIQRKFVWDHEQIERLFDSIMLGYPIGTFLFWHISKDVANQYTFYKFIQEYHERDKYKNEKAPTPEMRPSIIGVLDGQQRLSSLYLSLQGSYAYKKPRARWDNDDAFPKRFLYLNLLDKKEPKETDETTYTFKFLTIEEASVSDENTCWFPVKEALQWEEASDFTEVLFEKGLAQNKLARNTLSILWSRITQNQIINYYEVKSEDLDEVLEIFIRVNSGGTILSKSDLLFSTIVASWEQAREEIEILLVTINGKGEKFDFDNDFILRACLVLTDCPVLFSVGNLKAQNIQKIRDSWESIKNSIKKTIDLLVEFGFNRENLTSKNAIIPIAYFLHQGGRLDETDKLGIRKYLVFSLLKQIYGGKGDRVLGEIRSMIKKSLKDNSRFPMELLLYSKLPSEKSLSFNNEDIENLLEQKKSPYTFMVLSLMYPHLKLGMIKFHQDHLHPSSAFSNAKLQSAGVPKEKWKEWQIIKDTIVNLQLLEGSENESKNKTPLKSWYEMMSGSEQTVFLSQNYIPDVDLSLNNFDEFVTRRRELLKNKFIEILSV